MSKHRTYGYDRGDRVIANNLNAYSRYNGQWAVVVSPLGDHTGRNVDGSYSISRNTYQIVFADGQIVNVDPEQLAPAMPTQRSDLDIRVTWESFNNPALVRIIREDPKTRQGEDLV